MLSASVLFYYALVPAAVLLSVTLKKPALAALIYIAVVIVVFPFRAQALFIPPLLPMHLFLRLMPASEQTAFFRNPDLIVRHGILSLWRSSCAFRFSWMPSTSVRATSTASTVGVSLRAAVGAEFLKIKRRGLPYLFGGAALFSVLVSYLPSIESEIFDWQELLSAGQFVHNQVLFLLASYVTGFIFAGEYENRTVESVFSTPITPGKLAVSKIFTVLALSSVSAVWTAGFSMLSGVVFGFGRLSQSLSSSYVRSCPLALLFALPLPFVGPLSRRS